MDRSGSGEREGNDMRETGYRPDLNSVLIKHDVFSDDAADWLLVCPITFRGTFTFINAPLENYKGLTRSPRWTSPVTSGYSFREG